MSRILPGAHAGWFGGRSVTVVTEHFPNPYKPWIVHQIEEMRRRGAEVRVLAFGAFPERPGKWGQQGREVSVGYLPATFLEALRSADPRRLVGTTGTTALAREVFRTRHLGGLRASVGCGLRTLQLPGDSPDLWYIHDLTPAARLAFLKERFPDALMIISFNGGEVAGLRRHPLAAEALRRADGLVALSRFAAAQLEEVGGKTDQVRIMPLGFPLDRYVAGARTEKERSDPTRFITVGRLSPEKGIDDAIRAMALLKGGGLGDRIRLRIVGNGISGDALRQLAAAEGVEDIVTFVGELAPDGVAAELGAADALLLPSHKTSTWAETQATVVQEALLLGCAAITTDAGALRETNPPSMHRFFFRQRDPGHLAEKLREFISLEAVELRKCTIEAEAIVRSRYDIRATVGQLEQLAGELRRAKDAGSPESAAVPATGEAGPGRLDRG